MTITEMAREALHSLEEGDDVVVLGGHRPSLEKITRVTKNLIHVGEDKYLKSTGVVVGSGFWSTLQIEAVTPERKAAIITANERTDLLITVNSIRWNVLSTKTLLEIFEVVMREKEAEHAEP